MSEQNAVPEGFRLDSDTTEVGGLEYAVEYLQAESLRDILAYYAAQGQDGEAVVCGVWNAHNKQGAIQSPKAGIRKAQGAEDGDVGLAISAAQETTRTFITGAPRQKLGGTTKTAARDMGVAIAEARAKKGSGLSKAELDAIMAEYMTD